jgi:hypothetical protein
MTTIDKKENELFINIESTLGEEDDTEKLERITHNLRDDLKELDSIEKVDLTKTGEIPRGAKAGEEIILGSLLVELVPVISTALPHVVKALQSWLRRNDRHKISLEIRGDKLEVTGISDEERQRLIDAWISRHT